MRSMTTPELLQAWRMEEVFFTGMAHLRAEGPNDKGMPSLMYFRYVLAPAARSRLERLCRELGRVHVPVELIEGFRAKVLDDYAD